MLWKYCWSFFVHVSLLTLTYRLAYNLFLNEVLVAYMLKLLTKSKMLYCSLLIHAKVVNYCKVLPN